MQFKLMNQTWENDENLNFRANFGPLDQIKALKFFFLSFTFTNS